MERSDHVAVERDGLHDEVPPDTNPHEAGDVLVDQGPVVVVPLRLDDEDQEGGDEESCHERK